jgi:hypothetical protein
MQGVETCLQLIYEYYKGNFACKDFSGVLRKFMFKRNINRELGHQV